MTQSTGAVTPEPSAICPSCGKVMPKRRKSKQGKYCNRICYSAAISGKLKPEAKTNRDFLGQIFSGWQVVEMVEIRKSKPYYKCACKCGNVRVIELYALLRGNVRKCKYCFKIVSPFRSHGKSYTKVFNAWSRMKTRCLDENKDTFEHYGGRGISVHPTWVNSFENFYAYVGEPPTTKHSLDRINVNGNYEPGNVRWATSKQQQNNRRNNVYLEYNGEVKTQQEWANILKIHPGRIYKGRKKGRPFEAIYNYYKNKTA